MLCGARQAGGTEGRADSSLQRDPPGILQGQGVFTIHLNIAGDEVCLSQGANEGLYRG